MASWRENRHSILVESAPAQALLEIIRWGESPWWPKSSLMTFKREGSGAVQAGTRYRQKVLLPLAPSWDVEVTSITQDSITRKFLNGMFTGEETVNLHPKAQGLEVQYLMHYQINGVLNNVLWKLMFERLHNSNIEAILQNLKKDLERQR